MLAHTARWLDPCFGSLVCPIRLFRGLWLLELLSPRLPEPGAYCVRLVQAGATVYRCKLYRSSLPRPAIHSERLERGPGTVDVLPHLGFGFGRIIQTGSGTTYQVGWLEVCTPDSRRSIPTSHCGYPPPYSESHSIRSMVLYS